MSNSFTVLVIGAVLGLGLGFILGATLAGLGVLWAKQRLDGYTAHITEQAVAAALGMVKDITQTRSQRDPGPHPIVEAVEAEAQLFAARRRMEIEQAQNSVMLKEKAKP